MSQWSAAFMRINPRNFVLSSYRRLQSTATATWDSTVFESSKEDFIRRCAAIPPMILPKRGDKEGAGRPQITIPRSNRNSAILVPFCTVHGVPSILYTLRSTNLTKHRGEISFPGGRADETDKDLVETALRETEEEIGLERNKVDIWTSLPPMPARDGTSFVTAVVGYCGEISQEDFLINEMEVEEIFACSLKILSSPETIGYTTFRTRQGFRMPVFIVKDAKRSIHIWGMTAITTLKILQCFREKFHMDYLSSVTKFYK